MDAILSGITGDEFDEFYRRELPAMIALARSICGDQLAGEDLAQEALARAHRHWNKVRHYERPGAWVRRVTINLALSRRRRLVREIAALARVAREPTTGTATATDPDAEIWAAVRTLPPKQRAAIALFYQEDRSTQAIAEILGCSVSTATSHLNLGRKRLALLLGDAEPEDVR